MDHKKEPFYVHAIDWILDIFLIQYSVMVKMAKIGHAIRNQKIQSETLKSIKSTVEVTLPLEKSKMMIKIVYFSKMLNSNK